MAGSPVARQITELIRLHLDLSRRRLAGEEISEGEYRRLEDLKAALLNEG